MSIVLSRGSWPVGAFTGSTRTEPLALPAGTGRRLVVLSVGFSETTGLTYDGSAASPAGSSVNLLGVQCRAFWYDVPDAKAPGTYNLVFSFAGGDGHTFRPWFVNGATGPVTQHHGSNASGGASATVDTMVDDLLFALGFVVNPSGTGVTYFGSTQIASADATGDSSLSGFRSIAADALADAVESVSWAIVPSPDTEPSGVFLVRMANAPVSSESAGRRRIVVKTPPPRQKRRHARTRTAVVNGASVTPAAAPSLMGAPWSVAFPVRPSYSIRFSP